MFVRLIIAYIILHRLRPEIMITCFTSGSRCITLSCQTAERYIAKQRAILQSSFVFHPRHFELYRDAGEVIIVFSRLSTGILLSITISSVLPKSRAVANRPPLMLGLALARG